VVFTRLASPASSAVAHLEGRIDDGGPGDLRIGVEVEGDAVGFSTLSSFAPQT